VSGLSAVGGGLPGYLQTGRSTGCGTWVQRLLIVHVVVIVTTVAYHLLSLLLLWYRKWQGHVVT
jgi:hypothetical protein